MTGIPNYFQTDNFRERRNSGESAGVRYDPESLLTGAEEAAGLGYHDKRVWPDAETYRLATEGKLTSEQIAQIAPRVRVAPKAPASNLSPFATGSAVGLEENPPRREIVFLGTLEDFLNALDGGAFDEALGGALKAA